MHLKKIIRQFCIKDRFHDNFSNLFLKLRFGVAPDHQDVKKCISTFNKVADLPNVSFIGNSTLGKDFSFGKLRWVIRSDGVRFFFQENRYLAISPEDLILY